MTTISVSASRIAEVLGINFDADQLAAISAPLKPGVIVAGAGSGKTAVMTARVVYLVANKLVAPESVLGLTFTNLATGELQSRVRDALSLLTVADGTLITDSGEPTVSTYHSFAGELIREFGVRIGIEPEHLLLSDVRRQQLAMRMLRSTTISLADCDMPFSTVLDRMLELDDALSDFAVNIESLTAFDSKLVADVEPYVSNEDGRAILRTSRNRIVLAQLVKEFRQYKRDHDCLDYADMTRLSLEIFTAQPELVTQLRDRFKVVLLDEYQDTSTAQRRLMHALFGDGHPITAVGDGLQSIYVFRGANPRNIDLFPEHFSHNDELAQIQKLPVTQRNGHNIVAVANALTMDLRQADAHPLALPLKAKPDPKYGDGEARLGFFETAELEADWLADHIRTQSAAGVRLDEMAVLLRRREDVGWFYRALAERGINVQVRTKQDLLDIPEVAEVVSYLRVIAEPTANEAWVRILTGARLRISNRDLKLIADEAQRLVSPSAPRARDLNSILESTVAASDRLNVIAYGDAIAAIARDGHPTLSADALQRVRLLAREVDYFRRHTSEPLVDFVQRVINITGLMAEATAHPSRIASGMPSNLRSFVSMAADFTSLDGQSSLFAFLSWLEDAKRLNAQGQLTSVVQGNAVQLMTVHSSKGLQFRLVAVPRLASNIFPSKKGQDRWPTNPHVIPDFLRADVSDPVLKDYPPRGTKLTAAVTQPFVDACKRLDDLDERRLIYVAVTRAQETLLVSSALQIPGEDKLRPPSKYLEEMRDHLDEEFVTWFEIPDDLESIEVEPLTAQWPVALDSPAMTAIAAAASEVHRRLDSGDTQPTAARGGASALIAGWDRAIAALERDFESKANHLNIVELPYTLSVSQIQRLHKDEQRFLQDLIRPMPTEPAFAAQQGTDFHAWVELRARAMMGAGHSAVLPGMEDFDSEPYSLTPNLQKFIDTFEQSEWAQRIPHEVEFPFVYSVAGRAIRGVIDAVFRQPDGTWLLVDWKTNAAPNADPVQLSIYRLAWARLQGCSLDEVACAFYYVALDQTVVPERYLSEAELSEIVAKDETIR